METMIGKALLEIDRVLFWACAAYVAAGMFGWVRVDRGAKDLPGNRVKFGPNWIGLACFGVIITMIPSTVRMFWHLQWGLLNLVMPVGMAILLVEFLRVFLAPSLLATKGWSNDIGSERTSTSAGATSLRLIRAEKIAA
jgi:hypothetical protein